jgi:hypothetical protein
MGIVLDVMIAKLCNRKISAVFRQQMNFISHKKATSPARGDLAMAGARNWGIAPE